MKRVFTGSVGYFLKAAPYIKNLNQLNINILAKRLNVSTEMLELLLKHRRELN
jgi:hypothetical protein